MEDPEPELTVSRPDVKVYQILIKKVVIARQSTNLCENIHDSYDDDLALFRKFPRTDNEKQIFGEPDDETEFDDTSASNVMAFPDPANVKPQDMPQYINQFKAWLAE